MLLAVAVNLVRLAAEIGFRERRPFIRGELISLGIAFAARRIARRPSNESMTFGYVRAEIVAALINGPPISARADTRVSVLSVCGNSKTAARSSTPMANHNRRRTVRIMVPVAPFARKSV